MLTLLPRKCLTARLPYICTACRVSALGATGPQSGRKALSTRSGRARHAQKRSTHGLSVTHDVIDQLRKALLAEETEEQSNTRKPAKKKSRKKKKSAAPDQTSSQPPELLSQSDAALASTEIPQKKNSKVPASPRGKHPSGSQSTGGGNSKKSDTAKKRSKKSKPNLKDTNESTVNTPRQTLVAIIQNSNLPLNERLEAMRALRGSLMKTSLSNKYDNPAVPRSADDSMGIKEAMSQSSSKKKATASRGVDRKRPAKPKPVRTGPMQVKAGFEINSVNAGDLRLVPLETPQPPVPKLSYGLERVLFNPGVYHLQDPRSRVFNFDPYLAKIMPVSEFDFNALKQYITSSRDETLLSYAKAEGKKYTGSTSSMTAALAHFHFLLSQWRPINTGALSQNFPIPFSSFTALQRSPSAIFLRWRNGVYAIDGDKQYDTANILSMLGKSMEKLLTLSTEEFERYRRENSDQITEAERNEAEAFNYTTIGDFLLRSQLDAHDPRLPGTGMFDLKTRAVVSIRMDAKEYEKGMGYEIRGRHGEYESFEREYYDMIRAAFLKYSLQVRMGRMDGIFVAFHNTERIFGFQYISLSEMDYALHGTDDTTTGDAEFKLSLELLNRALDKATAKFPERSLRLHFETRNSETPFMYIFAEPLPEEEIQAIQDSNKAEILDFERSILGLDAKTEEELLEERKAAEWQALRTRVEESMEKDEVNINEARQFAEVMLEESDSMIGQLSAEEKERFMDEVMAGFEERVGRGTESSAADDAEESEEEIMEDNQDTGATAIGDAEDDDDEIEDVNEDDALDEDEEEHEDDDDGEESEEEEDDEGEQEEEDDEEEENLEEESEDNEAEQDEADKDTGAEIFHELTDVPNGVGTQQTLFGDQASANEQIEPEIIENKQLLPEEEKLLTDDTKEGTQPADELTMGETSETAQSDDETTLPPPEVMAMTLTIRNKVNGQYTERPTDLTPKDKWTVEYALADIAPGRAQTLYQATKRRRHAALSSDRADDSNPYNNAYIAKLKALSQKGRVWRSKIEKEQGPLKVLGSKYEPSSSVDADKEEK